MSTATAQVQPKPKTAALPLQRISKEQFLLEYSNKEDGYKYEWNDGIVEKTKAMNQQQTTLYLLLNRLFFYTEALKNGGGLSCETEMDTTAVQYRRPDITFFTGEQIARMKKGEKQVAPWLAEVISPTDRAEDIYAKLLEYFSAGVQVVWHIFPHTQQVYVYTSPDNVTICRGGAVCSGAPVLPDLVISADALFE